MSNVDARNAPAPGPAARPTTGPTYFSGPFFSHKVLRRHVERQALVYVRQSTPYQVVNNCESTARQYALADRAVALGWGPERVEVVDDDQGKSGASAEGRPGFQSVLARVALGEVGIVLGLEMSRLARSGKDWHQLLELCAIFGVLLADQDGVYDPADPNDRLLLGLKGTMSEAELYTLKARMHQGLLNKARRGEVFNHPPIGYVKSSKGGLAFDPDEQARSVARLIFEQFERLGSVCALLRYLVQNGIMIPVRPHSGERRGELEWHRPNRVTLLSMLHHPVYAGYYRWGHRRTDPRKKKPGKRQSGRAFRKPGEEGLVLLEGRCPAYISVERFGANQEVLSANRAAAPGRGAPREGPGLLGGLLVCGHCGYRMSVNYTDSGRNLRYCCCRDRLSYGGPDCQSLSGRCLDELVAREVLAALDPEALELHLKAADDVERQRQRLHEEWRQRLERAHYQSGRAARQYQACEPENRLVARELERAWEEALKEEDRLKTEYDRFQQAQPERLSEEEKEQIRQLACDVPALWQAQTTTGQDRQRLVRFLVDKVVATVQGQTEQVAVAIHWAGGLVSRHGLARGVQRYEQLADYPRLCGRIDELRAAGRSMDEVAACLNEEGFRPAKRVERFTGGMVSGLLERRCKKGAEADSGPASFLEKGEWLLGELARHLGVPAVTLHRWRKGGWLRARKLDVAGGHWAVWATGPERRRLGRLRRFQQGHPNQPIPAELTTPDALARTD